MSILQSILLGIVQGLTEFLPISSSGHLAITGKLFGVQETGLFFDSLLHIGTLVAVFIAFRKLIWSLIKSFFAMIGKIFTGKFSWKRATADERMIVMLIVSCFPLVIALILKDYIDHMSEYLWMVGVALFINGFILLFCDHVKSGKKTAKDMGFKNALAVGFVQLIAVVPGISRSGSTITGGVASGLDREFAAQYSFILSIPTILAGALVSFLDAMGAGAIEVSMLPSYILGTIAAGVVGFFAIRLLQYLLKSKKFFIFSIYCFVVGIASIVADILFI